MVIRPLHPRARRRGSLMIELLAAMTILIGSLIPLAYSITSERRLARAYYERAVAMEIVDGEMEVLLAGAWRAFTPGTHDYQVNAAAATNLPPGKLSLTVADRTLRLEWVPSVKHHGGKVVREAKLP